MANRAGKQKRKRYRKLERKLASRRGNSQAAAHQPQLIGFTARRKMEMVCNDHQCCVVIGSRDGLIGFLKKRGLAYRDHVIESASAEQVISGMVLGGEYALDRQAFEQFLPLARAAGLNLEAVELPEDPPDATMLAELSLPNIQYGDWIADLIL